MDLFPTHFDGCNLNYSMARETTDVSLAVRIVWKFDPLGIPDSSKLFSLGEILHVLFKQRDEPVLIAIRVLK